MEEQKQINQGITPQQQNSISQKINQQKTTILQSPLLKTQPQKDETENLLKKTIIAEEILTPNPTLLQSLQDEKKINSLFYQIINDQKRIDKAIERLKKLQQKKQTENNDKSSSKLP